MINCWVVVENLFQKEKEAIRKVDKDPIADHYGDEVFEQKLRNEGIESIKQGIRNKGVM